MSKASKTETPSATAEPQALDSPAGRTTFAPSVVGTIAGIAAREIHGVHKLGTGLISDAVARVAGTSDTTAGVRSEVGLKEAAFDLDLVANYGIDLHGMAVAVREQVSRRVQSMTGLRVTECNAHIVDIHYEANIEQPRRRVE